MSLSTSGRVDTNVASPPSAWFPSGYTYTPSITTVGEEGIEGSYGYNILLPNPIYSPIGSNRNTSSVAIHRTGSSSPPPSFVIPSPYKHTTQHKPPTQSIHKTLLLTLLFTLLATALVYNTIYHHSIPPTNPRTLTLPIPYPHEDKTPVGDCPKGLPLKKEVPAWLSPARQGSGDTPQPRGDVGTSPRESDIKFTSQEVNPEGEDDDIVTRQNRVLPLLYELNRPRFKKESKLTDEDLRPIKDIFRGALTDEFTVQGKVVQRRELLGFLPEGVPGVHMLHLYAALVRNHIDHRVAKGLQDDVAVLSSLIFMEPWRKFFVDHNQIPKVPRPVLKRCRTAKKVLFVLPAPIWDSQKQEYRSGTGHFVVAVINRQNGSVTVVDPFPKVAKYYDCIREFLLAIGNQIGIHGDAQEDKYVVSPYLPEPGFGLQGKDLQQDPPAFLQSACGLFCLEIMLCIAEERKPNFNSSDVLNIRYRMLLELFQNLWPRELEDKTLRAGLNY